MKIYRSTLEGIQEVEISDIEDPLLDAMLKAAEKQEEYEAAQVIFSEQERRKSWRYRLFEWLKR